MSTIDQLEECARIMRESKGPLLPGLRPDIRNSQEVQERFRKLYEHMDRSDAYAELSRLYGESRETIEAIVTI